MLLDKVVKRDEFSLLGNSPVGFVTIIQSEY